ncbi:MAG: diacylglycerol kinase family protein [candidate division KSB1 bacterium]|nr:diacylglycerol kinase family protein [candidate division KSB1 bacterium]
MRYMIIENPYAAGGESKKHFPHIEKRFRDCGVEYKAVETRNAADAEQLAYTAAKQFYDMIIAVGGDGTINQVVNGIMKADAHAALGIIPAGTCNDFIKSVGIPESISRACDIILSGKTLPVDVALAGDRFFINAIGIGFDVKVVQDLALYSYLPGKLAYYAAVFKNIFRYKALPLDIHSKTDRHQMDMVMLAVTNGQYYGGSFHIAPTADVMDGMLNVVMVHDLSAFKRVLFLPKVAKGTHLSAHNVDHFTTTELSIRSSTPLTLQIEGELMQWPEPFISISSIHRGLNVACMGDA